MAPDLGLGGPALAGLLIYARAVLVRGSLIWKEIHSGTFSHPVDCNYSQGNSSLRRSNKRGGSPRKPYEPGGGKPERVRNRVQLERSLGGENSADVSLGEIRGG